MDLELDVKSNKNSLSIRLTESAVFLSTAGHSHGRRNTEQRSTLLRGLLILQLVKPTRIASIEVELTATASTAWPEGIGPRRVELNEEHNVYHASTVYFRATNSHTRRSTSIGPGISYINKDIDDDPNDWDLAQSNETPIHTTAGSASPSNSRSSPSRSGQRMNRQVSVDTYQFRRMSLEDLPTRRDIRQLPPIPSYSPFALTTHGVNTNFVPPATSSHTPTSPVQRLEDPRHSPYVGRRGRATSPGISRYEDTIPEDDTLESGPDANRSNRPALRLMPTGSATLPPLPLSPTVDSHSPTSPLRPLGRRFSLSAVSNVIIDAVRSTSPKPGTSRFRERDNARNRDRSVETPARVRRGRTMERGGEQPVNLNGDIEEGQDLRQVKEKGRGIIAMMLGEKEKVGDDEGWKEFKKGTYSFPISFNIPGNAPPSMVCDYGSVFWRLKATVHRPGAFKSKMTAVREVIIVACPTADDTEDTENIIVERHWGQQMQYLISVSGRSFHIGGTVPVTFTILPLTKVNIYRLSVILEERVDYYTNMRRIARTDPIARFSLLSIRGDDNYAPILPLRADDPDALRHSPLFALVDPSDNFAEVSSSLMGPGPWTLHKGLKLPGTCTQMKFSNKNHQSNIIVSHTLKLMIRVERGDDLFIDAKTGKRKMFDIVVQTPVLILSCRCNPDWISLPPYSKVLDDSTSFVPDCPCRASQVFHPSDSMDTLTSSSSSDSGASVAETSSVSLTSSPIVSLRQLRYNEAVLRSSSLFERLVSGQESVSGEVPPAYDEVGSETNDVAVS